MIQFKLKKEWWSETYADNCHIFKIISVDIENLFHYENEIKWLIDSFNNRYEWDGFPKWDDVIDRVKSKNNFLFLCQYNQKIIGWGWFRIGEVVINKDNIKFYAKTNDTTVCGYNKFLVSNKIIKKPENSGKLWLSLCIKTLFENGITEVLGEAENWQEAAIAMQEGAGLRRVDWISELFKDA